MGIFFFSFNLSIHFLKSNFQFSDAAQRENSANILDAYLKRENNYTILEIKSVSYTDSGFYECIADNGIPPIIKTNFSITIRGKSLFSLLIILC